MTKREFFNELQKMESPEIVYLLGYLWGDGFIVKPTSPTGVSFRVGLTIQKEDALVIKPIFDKMDFIKIKERHPPNKKPTIDFSIYCKEIYQWFEDNDYKAKSWVSADKILSKIPEHLKHYWFRGLVDADGSIRFAEQSKQGKKGQVLRGVGIHIYSGINQDWKYMIDLCKKFNLKYKIVLRQRSKADKTHCSSQFSNQRRPEVIILGDYIWKDKETDGIGLNRKWAKFLLIKEYDKNSPVKLF